MRPIKVVIIDRNDITRKGVEAVIGAAGDPYQVVGDFARLRDAEKCLAGQIVDLLIMDDQTVAPTEIVRLVKRCHDQHPSLAVIVLTVRRDGDYIEGVMGCGNASYILKDFDTREQLLKALPLASSHFPFLSPDVIQLLGTRPVGPLTHRDRDVLRLLAQEMSIKEIGVHLGISDKSVYRTRDKLKKVLRVRNNESLVDAARQQGLLGDEQ